MTISVAITWILFLGLFPIAFFWLRRAWRILVERDFSEVALKGGVSPADPEKFAPYAAAINLLAGGIVVAVVLMIVIGGVAYDIWSAIAGSTIWMKFLADYILRHHAHPTMWGKKKQAASKDRP